MKVREIFIRNIDVGDILEAFLITSISSILFIRFFLAITGYPQLGGGSFHISHMLLGGILLLIAIVLLLSFLGNKILKISAVIGGIGFGIFIDELGKFITRDNNYFFQPTIALIYLIFLLLFFIFRFIEHKKSLTDKEYLMNALQLFEEAILNDMDMNERKRLLSFLEHTKSNDAFTRNLKLLANTIEIAPDRFPNILSVLLNKLNDVFDSIMKSKNFRKVIIISFIIQTFLSLLIISLVMISRIQYLPDIFKPNPSQYTLVTYGEFLSTILSVIFLLIGISKLKFSKYQAYSMFKYSILVSILVTRFFIFYREQFTALYGLALNIIALTVINYIINNWKKEDEIISDLIK